MFQPNGYCWYFYLKPEPTLWLNWAGMAPGFACSCRGQVVSISISISSLLGLRFDSHMEWKHIILAAAIAPWYLTGPDLKFKCLKKFGIHGWEYGYSVSAWREKRTHKLRFRSDGSTNFSEYRRSHSQLIICSSRSLDFFLRRMNLEIALILFNERDGERYRDVTEVSSRNDQWCDHVVHRFWHLSWAWKMQNGSRDHVKITLERREIKKCTRPVQLILSRSHQ